MMRMSGWSSMLTSLSTMRLVSAAQGLVVPKPPPVHRWPLGLLRSVPCRGMSVAICRRVSTLLPRRVLLMLSVALEPRFRPQPIAQLTLAPTAAEPGTNDAADQQPREPPNRNEPNCALRHEVKQRQHARCCRDESRYRQRSGQLAGA